MSYGEDPKIPCCMGNNKCNGTGMTIDGGHSAFPLKPRGERVCDECLHKVIPARNEYINKCAEHYDETEEHLALKDGCAYCGNFGFTVYMDGNKIKAKYGEYCSMGCAMMSSNDDYKINN
tara:strand:- start:23 stop:382 length:360 start_codon:yes stop_codon:yes gene_type:complete